MILLEGCDGSGKTTLATQIAKHYETKTIHFGGSADEETLKTRLKSMKHGKLYDRCPIISEIIYGGTIRKDPKFSLEDLNEFLRKNQPLIIYCNPGLGTLLTNKHEGRPGEDPQHISDVNENIFRIWQAYEYLMVQLPAVRWDFRNHSTDYANVIMQLCRFYLGERQ